MLLPTTLSTARSVVPLAAAPTDTAISGALVPRATMVKPTTRGEIPQDSDDRAAPRVRPSAPATRTTTPTMSKTMDIAWTSFPGCNVAP